MEPKIVTVVGGSGFLGRYTVKRLAEAGYRINVLCRDTQAASFLKPLGDVGQITIQHVDITKIDTLGVLFSGSYAVINLVGVLYEKGAQTFSGLHAKFAEKIAEIAAHSGVKKFIHISALGVDKAITSEYARTKLQGETAVLTAFPTAVILRPSVVFGPEDDFYNRFAKMACQAPALPLIGDGATLFQPVYVADVAEAVVSAISDTKCEGKIYELGGPKIYSMYEILHFIMKITGRKRLLVRLPYFMANLFGKAGEYLPVPPLTSDQVQLLKYDNIVSPKAKGFEQLNIQPCTPEIVVPEYLARYKR